MEGSQDCFKLVCVFFFFSFDVVVERLGLWITDSRVFSFVEESLISFQIFYSCCDRKWERITWLFIYLFIFNRVGRVNSEYQSSHPSPTNSRSSFQYLVSDSSWSTLLHIRLDQVVPDSTDFLSPAQILAYYNKKNKNRNKDN